MALAVSALFFPPDPALFVGRAAQAVFAGLGGALERLATALAATTPSSPREALAEARGLDALITEFNAALETGRETARLSPRRRATHAAIERFAASFTEVDFAIRDTRVLARHSVRMLRARRPVPATLPRGDPRARRARSGRSRAPSTSPSAPTPSAAMRCGRGSIARDGARREVLGADPLDRGRPAPRGRPHPRARDRATRSADRRAARPRCDYRGRRAQTHPRDRDRADRPPHPLHADWNGDGPGDVLAVPPDGRLLLYTRGGEGRAARGRQAIGSGWAAFTALLAPGDFSGDGHPDLLVRAAAGRLQMYRGNGTGGGRRPSQRQVGTSWEDFTALLSPATSPATAAPTCSRASADGAARCTAATATAAGSPATGEIIGSGWPRSRRCFAAGDFSGDGKPRRLRPPRRRRTAHVPRQRRRRLGDGPRRTGRQRLGAASPRWPSGGDFSGDGKPDILARTREGALLLYRGNGAERLGDRPGEPIG